MPRGAIARRYAGAIFDIARKQNTLDRTNEDVQEMAALFSNRKLAYLLREPKIPAKRKETAIRQALGSRVQPTSLNLALLVVQRGLVDVMPSIADEYKQLLLDYKNQAEAEVTTATQLDDAQLALVKQALEQRTGKTILMHTEVDPEILGGVVARVGDQVIDGSVRHRLAVLQQRLLNSVSSASFDSHSEEVAEGGQDARGGAADAAAQQQPASSEGYDSVPDTKPRAYRP